MRHNKPSNGRQLAIANKGPTHQIRADRTNTPSVPSTAGPINQLIPRFIDSS